MSIERKTIANDESFLRQVSIEVDFSDSNLSKEIAMLRAVCMEDDNILALASIQISIPKRLVYIRSTDLNAGLEDKAYDESIVLINPVILEKQGLSSFWEACVSCLDQTGLVKRPYRVLVGYYDEQGINHQNWFEGLAATIICHEIDHLDGILHIDIAEEILLMNFEERFEFRKTHLYEIISKTGSFDKLNKTRSIKKQTS